MGSEVDKLHKKLNGQDLDTISAVFVVLVVYFGIPFGVPFLSIEPVGDSDTLLFIITMGGVFIWLFGLFGMVRAVLKFQADVNEFIRAYKKDYPTRSEIEILEMAYSDALSYAYGGLKDALVAWLLLGTWVPLVEITIISGNATIGNSFVFWFGIRLASILSFAGFILTIFYLRKRSIEKALFAIQLKKSDKAEISIKI